MSKAVFLMAVVMAIAPAFAEQDSCRCDLTMYVDDPDTAGTNVRASPGGEIVLVLPRVNGGFHSVRVCDAKNGWFKVKTTHAGASIVELDMKSPLWIHGSVVAVDPRPDSDWDIPVYSRPSHEDTTRNTFKSPFTFVGCRGGWLKCAFTGGALHGQTGWMAPENQCPNPLTTCP
jgi:hypothetical protein